MKTWIVITEIFLLGLWIDDWGLEVAPAGLRGVVRQLSTLTPTPFFATFMSLSNESIVQRWYGSVWVRPPPPRE
ncbi:MAG TPA: hypothetical protein VLI39_02825 [Sedimentisphaerales bacterium]|nr:hypothetical protein [Sedimentisphaerales bacterium]